MIWGRIDISWKKNLMAEFRLKWGKFDMGESEGKLTWGTRFWKWLITIINTWLHKVNRQYTSVAISLIRRRFLPANEDYCGHHQILFQNFCQFRSESIDFNIGEKVIVLDQILWYFWIISFFLWISLVEIKKIWWVCILSTRIPAL